MFNMLIIFNNNLLHTKDLKKENEKDKGKEENLKPDLCNFIISLSNKYINEIRVMENLIKIINSLNYDVALINDLVNNGK